MKMKSVYGSIPEKVQYFVRGVTKHGFQWDDFTEDKEDRTVEVYPAYPVLDGVGRDKAKTWSNFFWHGQKAQGQSLEEKYNTPFSLRLITLEKRSQGGRAWKVIDKDNNMFDLREDVLLDALLNVGCEKDGRLKGEYIWAKLGSQSRIIRVDSTLHNKLKEYSEIANTKKISIKDLKRGSVYQNKKGEYFLYIGRGDAKKPYENKLTKNALIFFNPYNFDDINEHLIAKPEETIANRRGYFTVVKSHSLIKETGMTVGIDWEKLGQLISLKIGITEYGRAVRHSDFSTFYSIDYNSLKDN